MVRVAAAILENNGKVLLAQRRDDDPLGNVWEFPGGKIEAGETAEECLKRELREELGIDAVIGSFFCSSVHAYDHLTVELLVYRVRSFHGQMQPYVHTAIAWVDRADLIRYRIPEADRPVIDLLLREGIIRE